MEQIQAEGGIIPPDNAEDDLVVDTLEVERDIKLNDKEFVLPSGQIVGLDQAVLHSIERCRKCEYKFN